MEQLQHFDVVIIGGGLVGLTFACAIASANLSIAIVDAQPLSEQPLRQEFATRVSAINRASQRIFEALGLWQDMVAQRVSPYTKICVWEAGNNNALQFDCAELNTIPAQENLGNIIENQVMQRALIKKLKTHGNVAWFYAAKLDALMPTEQCITLTLATGQQLSGSLLIGADGGLSWTRQQMGITTTSWDYGHQAVVTNVRTELAHQQTAWQCFMPSGPLAFLPLADPHVCSIVWSTFPEKAKVLNDLSPQDFAQQLSAAFELRLGKLELLAPLATVPLRMTHAQQYVRPKFALIGDAAHTLHPLAGQGINLGLLDAACLAELVLAAHRKKKNIGALITLRRYERWRKGHNLGMISMMEGFKRIYANDNVLVKWARRTGMQALDKYLPAAKALLISHAMGLKGDLPGLARVRKLD